MSRVDPFVTMSNRRVVDADLQLNHLIVAAELEKLKWS